MPFFEDVDEIGIVERHIREVQALEEERSRAVLKSYTRVRQQLRDRLSASRHESFTAQQLRGVLAQVEAAIVTMTKALKGDMSSGAREAALDGVSHLTEEIETFSEEFKSAIVPIRLNAVAIATDTQNFLLNRYESSLAAYSEGVRGEVTRGLSDMVITGETSWGDMNDKVGSFFLGEEWKLSRIVRTELHHVYNLGKQNGMRNVQETVLPDLQKTLIHPMDSRTGEDSKYVSRKNLIVDIEEPFSYRWEGKTRTYMVPPDRPNDRSIMVPYRKVWDT